MALKYLGGIRSRRRELDTFTHENRESTFFAFKLDRAIGSSFVLETITYLHLSVMLPTGDCSYSIPGAYGTMVNTSCINRAFYTASEIAVGPGVRLITFVPSHSRGNVCLWRHIVLRLL